MNIENTTPSHKSTILKEMCPDCGKVAVEKFSIQTVDKDGNQIKLITLMCFHIIKKIIPRATPFETMVSNDWKPEVKNCKHEWPTAEDIEKLELQPTQCKKCGEFKLYDFQIENAIRVESGLAQQKGYGIFDDMGLGKTVQALAQVKFHNDHCPVMVVTKSAITFQWFKQIIRWLGPDYLPQIISTSKDFIFPGLKTYVISYDLLRRMPKEKIEKLGIKCVILDECQQIKNPDSTRTKEVRNLVSNPDCKVLPLSGTPWKNRGSEFFTALNMIDPYKFSSYQGFLDTWVDFYWEGAKKKMGGIKNPIKFKEFTRDLLCRHEYDEVMKKSPFINRMKLPVQLDELSQSTYDDSESDFVDWYNELVIGGEEDTISGIEILAQMSRMRHVTGLAKIPATLSFLEKFIEETDKKIVVFVHHKDVGESLQYALINTSKDTNPDWYELAQLIESEKVKVFKYTSNLSDVERFQMQEAFNKTPRAILIASTLACGEGVDLQTCADSILHERQWNPQNEDQATPGRFRRIGQLANTINITCPEAEGTIDEQLDTIVERKRKQFHAAMNRGEAPVWNEGDFAKELAEAIVAKHRTKKAKSGKTIKTNLTKAASLVKRVSPPTMLTTMTPKLFDENFKEI
jgi:SNF2 family DNA or RNA helicase